MNNINDVKECKVVLAIQNEDSPLEFPFLCSGFQKFFTKSFFMPSSLCLLADCMCGSSQP